MPTTDLIQAAILSYMKSQTSVTSLLLVPGANEIREEQWQGDIFSYPCVRVGVTLFPSIDGCRPDKASISVKTFSEEKSSLQAQQISAAIQTLFHRKPFTSNSLNFSMSIVQSVDKAERSVHAWESGVNLEVLVK